MAIRIRVRKKNNFYTIKAHWSGTNKDDELVKLGYVSHNHVDDMSPFTYTVQYQEAVETYLYLHRKLVAKAEKNGTKRPKRNITADKEVKISSRIWSDTVAINSATTAMIRLLKDPKALCAASGNTDPMYYRSKIIGCLSMLWD